MTEPTPLPTAKEAGEARPFRVLALDGGGIRGYYTASLLAGLLKHFETQTGRSNLDLGRGFDLISGTSTGGILGAALAHGVRPSVIATLYREKGPSIFAERFPELRVDPSSAIWACRHWEKPTAIASVLMTELAAVFGTTTLGELWESRKIALVLPSVSIEAYGPKVFKTPHLDKFTHDRQVKLTDACLATSAAPLFFRLHSIGKADGYYRNDLFVDGGLWANNPSLVGLIEAIDILTTRGMRRPIHIYSLGTCSGKVDQSRLKAHPEGGLKTWNLGKDVMELALITSANAMGSMTEILAKALSASGQQVVYARIPDPEMTTGQRAALGMDRADAQAFDVMEQLAATNESRILSGVGSDSAYQDIAEIFQNLPERP